jgi:branched-chain amino acid transport system permease protein
MNTSNDSVATSPAPGRPKAGETRSGGRERNPAGGEQALSKASFDWTPLALVAVLMVGAMPLIGSASSWLTLTMAGLAMGMIIFIIASGLTLVFGLMDVLNFGHGVFIAFGAFVATSVFGAMADWTASARLWQNLAVVFCAMLAAMTLAGALGWAFERVLVRPVY